MVSLQANDVIKSAVLGLLSSGLCGCAFNHSDIGGYCAVNLPFFKYKRDEELLLIWMELNAFTTIFRTHEVAFLPSFSLCHPCYPSITVILEISRLPNSRPRNSFSSLEFSTFFSILPLFLQFQLTHKPRKLIKRSSTMTVLFRRKRGMVDGDPFTGMKQSRDDDDVHSSPQFKRPFVPEHSLGSWDKPCILCL